MSLWHRTSKRLHPSHTLAISFFIFIMIGTGLLYTQWSCNGDRLSFIDALFTATSATCVTGLITQDTGAFFTRFGQLVILALIQLGGLGIMTFSTFFAYIIAGRFTLRGRDLIETSVSSKPVPYLGKLLLFTVVGTLIVEAIGAVILTFRFSQDYPLDRSIYLAIFHAVSAFCNAGFSLFSDSLIAYQNDWIINATVLCLIIIGGIGFWVLYDLMNLFKNGSGQLTLHSKLVLTVTASLVLFGAMLFLFFEWNHTLQPIPMNGKILSSIFQSVTARTAGFNTVDVGGLDEGSLLMLMILMVIGASPSSTGGGIKTTTFGVILALIFSRLRSQEQVRLFNRGIPESIVSKAIGISFFWIVTVTVAVMCLLVSESYGVLGHAPRGMMMDIFFECFSAFGTVGLSTGITPLLTKAGKVVIIILMYVGRIGPITLALAIANKPPLRIRYAEEKIIIG
ncbi:Trk family potassium uptake protein [candidate division KSB1 bacterium]|nr:Trk family potassium uptake protein [candidate division KSB1 bacterium]